MRVIEELNGRQGWKCGLELSHTGAGTPQKNIYTVEKTRPFFLRFKNRGFQPRSALPQRDVVQSLETVALVVTGVGDATGC